MQGKLANKLNKSREVPLLVLGQLLRARVAAITPHSVSPNSLSLCVYLTV